MTFATVLAKQKHAPTLRDSQTAQLGVRSDWRRARVPKLTTWQVSVAAEAFAAALFARAGYDVSVQYGANQPEYDLIVARGEKLLRVSVKGSQSGSWGLTQSFLKGADYHAAVEEWLSKHNRKTIIGLVQFKHVSLMEMPRVYLATPSEIASQLKKAAKGIGDTILYEDHKWGPRARGAGSVERIPDGWRFTLERIEELVGE